MIIGVSLSDSPPAPTCTSISERKESQVPHEHMTQRFQRFTSNARTVNFLQHTWAAAPRKAEERGGRGEYGGWHVHLCTHLLTKKNEDDEIHKPAHWIVNQHCNSA